MKMGIEQLSLVLVAACDAAMAVDGLAHHDGVLSLVKYLHDFKALGDLSAAALKAEVADLDESERVELVKLVKSKLTLQNPKLFRRKSKRGSISINVGMDLALNGLDVYHGVESLYARAKALVS
jgi:hypothetical protein